MISVSSFFSDLNGNVYGKLFSDARVSVSDGFNPDNSKLSPELEAVFSEKYLQFCENQTAYSFYPYVTLTRIAKGLGIKPFDEVVKDEPLAPFDIVRLADDELLSLPEMWGIIGLTYLMTSSREPQQIHETLMKEFRVPLSIHKALVNLANSQTWNAEMNGIRMFVEASFCEQLEKIIVEAVRPQMVSITPLEGLDAISYQHPTDRALLQAISKVRNVSKLFDAIINLSKRPYELFLMSNRHFITPLSHPRLYKLFWSACQILEVKECPNVYIDPSLGGINAFTTGTNSKAFVAISPLAATLLDDRELLYVFGHELGHIQCNHVRYHALADALLDASSLVPVLGPLVEAVSMPVIMPLLSAWLRTSELSCDRAGLLCCQSREAAMRALIKMSGQPWNQYDQIRTRSLIDQTITFLELKKRSRMDRVFEVYNRLYSSHPYTILRAAELLLWLQNGQYDEIVNNDKRGRQALARRVSEDAREQVLLASVAQFITDWHAEQGQYPRKQIARDVRKMLYEGITPTAKPLSIVGRILLDFEQPSADEIIYTCTFYTLDDENKVICVTQKLDYNSNRDEAPSSVRKEFLKNGEKKFQRVLYEVK